MDEEWGVRVCSPAGRLCWLQTGQRQHSSASTSKGLGTVPPCSTPVHEGTLCVHVGALCVHVGALCVHEVTLLVHVGALCVHVGTLCAHVGTVCVCDSAQSVWSSTFKSCSEWAESKSSFDQTVHPHWRHIALAWL